MNHLCYSIRKIKIQSTVDDRKTAGVETVARPLTCSSLTHNVSDDDALKIT